MWGFIKSRVYLSRPTGIPELKERIRGAFANVTAEIEQNVFDEYRKREEKVVANGGRHVEVHDV